MAILFALVLPACTPAAGPGIADPVMGPCAANRLGSLIGRPFSDSLRTEALRGSGARTARVIRPGDVVTMDYRADRLNIHLTASDEVERFACG
ncbi:MAG: I78 family peptidase inhibitor [Sphingomonas sp.]